MAQMAYFFQNNPYPGALNLSLIPSLGPQVYRVYLREVGEGSCIFAYSSKNSCLPHGFLELRSSQ